MAGPRTVPVDTLTRLGLTIAVLLLFSVSGGMLWLAGYNYDGLQGSPLSKIHPSTYLFVLAFVWRSCIFGNPVGYVVHVTNRRPATMLMAVISTVLLFVVILRQRPGMAGMIDTFVAPALLVLLLSEDDEKTFAWLQLVIHVVMTANALLALFEFGTKHLVFPYRFDGAVFVNDLRSTALQGHPLSNATVTSIYVLSLLSGSRSLSTPLRLALVGLQFCALVAFGGRSGMVLTILLSGVYLLIQGLAQLRTGRVNLLGAALAIMLAALLPLAIALAGYYGFFDALLERFVSDSGSANARVEMFDLFRHLELRDLIVGPDVDLLDSMRRITGLEQGIENPILRLTLYQGAFFTLLIFFGFALFMHEVARRCHSGIWLPMLGWLILLNTSESIASKTTLMTKFVVIALALYRPARPVARQRTQA
ncbi:VpsF family polysaccharide biosynthesis protein [Mesorhizobium sp. CA18]|nr:MULTISPECIES: VpsF family polysaccharide biosynthesis protein [unclassified Mesorhizobium]MBZ9736573.1 VpsF family polysaccharide biosynthesis protein [Mesorhizobium sp. CA9]MBZ9827213.1 VpsF family polysaccharide biosynthesis protein [Mesorhizobium sp. CA18]MBZ9832762.1 VpsF family polysaccharide biosynthesis protein [Mesorhizobium sp. CA2]MBZ9839039.1 VpsF family polysaccharide biosynthesis protein [Mesorhizobium sp. CA3]MBZ9879492.1 VpsF family polysaccharide biosynthesis protein [Mesorh